jgi:hypothetical protein
MHFSPQPSYQLQESNSQFAGSQSGFGPVHFESISLNRDDKSQNWNLLVRYLPPQPLIRAFGQAPQETREWPGNPGFLRIRFRL